MKYKFFLIVFISTYFFTTIDAQPKWGKIGGTIRNNQNKPFSGATVSLHNLSDTTIIQTGIADDNGDFLFKQLQYGSYSLIVTSVGFKDYNITRLNIDTQHTAIVLPVIILQTAGGKSLQEVVVASKRPLIEQKIDRTIINVDAMISAAGSDALDVLSKSPGVSVNANDDISFNGKSNVLVLIDDRPTYMSSKDLAAYLRALPGAMLDKLELINNPPARYDANGNAVINIVLKKNQAAGFNGSVTLGNNQGVYARSNNALNINYRRKNFNLFGNISYSHDQNFSEQSYRRYFFKSDGSLDKALFQNSYFTYQTNSWSGRIGVDYFISPHTTLGILLNGNTRPKTDVLNYATDQYDPLMQLDSVVNGFTGGRYSWKNNGINLNLQHSFNKKGRNLVANIDQLNYYAYNDQQSPVSFYRPDGSFYKKEQRLFSFPSTINIYTAKVDYTEPLKGKAQFTAGIKASYVKTGNQFNWFNQQGNNVLPDYSRSNHFKYEENINSAYVNLKKDLQRWSVQGGLRIEYTNGNAHQLSNPVIPDTSFTTHYTNLFPSLFILRKLDSAGNSTIVLSFGKRIGRPSYQQLNPFFFVDQYTYNAGNAQLKPSFGQYIECRYSYKQYLGITLSYGGGNNGINRVTQVYGPVFISTPLNFIEDRLLGIFPHLSLSPKKWYRVNLKGVFLFQSIKGKAAGVSLDRHTDVHEIEVSNQFHLSKNWSAELNGFFPGRQSYGQIKNDAVYNISAGVQKKILKGQGTVRFNANDIFYSVKLNSQTVGITQVAEYYRRKRDSRWVGFSFSYRFGKMANARKRNDAGSAEDEKTRTNNSNN
ncbi:MAG: TonB-dependent receptor [Ferruginibacter sp.]